MHPDADAFPVINVERGTCVLQEAVVGRRHRGPPTYVFFRPSSHARALFALSLFATTLARRKGMCAGAESEGRLNDAEFGFRSCISMLSGL